MVVGLKISAAAGLQRLPLTNISVVYSEALKQEASSEQQLSGRKCWGQRSEKDGFKLTTVTQITSHYNRSMQKNISEHTEDQTLKHSTPQSSHHLRLVIGDRMASTASRSQTSRAPLGRDGAGNSHHGCSWPISSSCDAAMAIWTEISEERFQHLEESEPLKQLWRSNLLLARCT